MAQLTIEIPDVVRVQAEQLGEVGEAWLAAVPTRVKELETEWQIKVLSQLTGGTASLVFAVEQISGKAAVLKLALPLPNALDNEMRALQLAKGEGYAKLLVRSVAHNALLLEQLGDQLASGDLPTADQIAVICQLLQTTWQTPEDPTGLVTGADKANWHKNFITEQQEKLGQPLPGQVVEQALKYCDERAAAFNPETSVLVHGDAHAWNTLKCLGDEEPVQYKLVDPDGLFAEPAFDLAILLREWRDELLAGDPLVLGQERLHLLHELTQVPEDAIWQWALIEQVSGCLSYQQMDMPEIADQHKAIATAWYQPEQVVPQALSAAE